MNSILITPENKIEYQFLTEFLKRMHIKAKIVRNNIKEPNETTLKAIKEVYEGRVTRAKNANV